MSLERKDFRGKLHPDMHAAMAVICDADGLDHGEWIEQLIVEEVRRRVHAASLISTGCARLGIAGSGRELPGIAGNGRE